MEINIDFQSLSKNEPTKSQLLFAVALVLGMKAKIDMHVPRSTTDYRPRGHLNAEKQVSSNATPT